LHARLKEAIDGGKAAVPHSGRCAVAIWPANLSLENIMANEKGPNVKKKAKCKNCEGKGLVKKGDKVVKCQRCHGTGLR
jgi:DnaJ-class molecular chaperone